MQGHGHNPSGNWCDGCDTSMRKYENNSGFLSGNLSTVIR